MRFLSAMVGTLKVLGKIGCLAGSGVFLRRQGYIDRKGTAMLGRIVMTVLLPCLLMSKLSESNTQTMRCAMGIPLCGAIFVCIAFTSGWLASRLLDLQGGFRRAFVVGCAFGNASSLPIVILTAVLYAYPALRSYSMPQAVAYASLYMPAQHFLLWSLGYGFLSADMDDEWLASSAPGDQADERCPLLPASLATPSSPLESPLARFREEWAVVKKRLNAPLVGIALGLLVAMVPPMHHLWIQPDSPLLWMRNAVDMLGAASIPINMMCLGSNLSQGPSKAMAFSPVVIICLIRFVWMPFVGICVVCQLHRWGILPSDRLLLLTCLVETSTPTANNVVTIATALDRGAHEISTCMFWQYLCFVVIQLFLLPVFISTVEALAPE